MSATSRAPRARGPAALWVAAAALLVAGEAPARAQDLNDTLPVFQVWASRCAVSPGTRAQTGFLVAGIDGIVTALHGVVGCPQISARRGDGAYPDLGIVQADIERDVAVLGSDSLATWLRRDKLSGQKRGSPPARKASVYVVGYPANVRQPIQMELEVEDVRKFVLDLVPRNERAFVLLEARQSPGTKSYVVSFTGGLQPGHSGAPIVTADGRVFAIGGGGLRGGLFGWGAPLSSIRPDSLPRQRIAQLGLMATEGLFSYGAARELALEPSLSISAFAGHGGRDYRASAHLPWWIGNRRFFVVLSGALLRSNLKQELETLPGMSAAQFDTTRTYGYASAGLEYHPWMLQKWEPYARVAGGPVFAHGVKLRGETGLGLVFFLSGRTRLFVEGTTAVARLPRTEHFFNRFGAADTRTGNAVLASYGVLAGLGWTWEGR